MAAAIAVPLLLGGSLLAGALQQDNDSRMKPIAEAEKGQIVDAGQAMQSVHESAPALDRPQRNEPSNLLPLQLPFDPSLTYEAAVQNEMFHPSPARLVGTRLDVDQQKMIENSRRAGFYQNPRDLATNVQYKAQHGGQVHIGNGVSTLSYSDANLRLQPHARRWH